MIEKIIFIKNKIIELILEQKILSAVIVLIIIMLTGITLLSSTPRNAKDIPLPSLVSIKPTITSPSTAVTKPKETTTPSLVISRTNTPPPLSPTTRITHTSPTASPTQGTWPTSKPVSPGTTSQPAIVPSGGTQPASPANPTYAAPNTNPTSVPSSGPQIVFIGPNGQPQTYTPPATPPVAITWARYTNQLEHYAIDYPSNWQIVTTQYRGHDAVFIYAPSVDLSDPDVQYISYGWSTYFYPPAASYVGSFTLDGVPGTIYTNGAIGSSFIAGVFNYANGFLVLNNNVSDATFVYIFDHMLLSLDFNTP